MVIMRLSLKVLALLLAVGYGITLFVGTAMIHRHLHEIDHASTNHVERRKLGSKARPKAQINIRSTNATTKLKGKKKNFVPKQQFVTIRGGGGGGKRTLQLGRPRKKEPSQPFRRLNIGERFPEYGAAEFAKRCPWADRKLAQGTNCTIFVLNPPGGNEGISSWFSQIAHGFIHAKQAGCGILVDYGQSVELLKVLAPNSHLHQWAIPRGFSCETSHQCYSLQISTKTAIPFPFEIPGVDRASLANVPNYRWAYSGEGTLDVLYRSVFQDLKRKLPGFEIESGMACSLGALFRLAPSASEFEPRLFTSILPALRDKDALVMTLYTRTGYADEAAKKEEAGEALTKEKDNRRKAEQILDCALTLELRHLAEDANAASSFSRVVWMVVTDSPSLKQWIAETYNAKHANAPKTSRTVPREVVMTGSRGVHTRPRRNPSTADFADALVDWWLIGESDVLVAHSHLTFGFTGALRTNRPFFDADGCSMVSMVKEKAKTAAQVA